MIIKKKKLYEFTRVSAKQRDEDKKMIKYKSVRLYVPLLLLLLLLSWRMSARSDYAAASARSRATIIILSFVRAGLCAAGSNSCVMRRRRRRFAAGDARTRRLFYIFSVPTDGQIVRFPLSPFFPRPFLITKDLNRGSIVNVAHWMAQVIAAPSW